MSCTPQRNLTPSAARRGRVWQHRRIVKHRLTGREAVNTWLSVGEGLIATAIAVIGSVFTYTANRRAEYDRVLALTAESATPPIAEDRHAIGKVFEPLSKLPRDRPIVLADDQIAALFRVLWYVQRVAALYQSLRSPLRERHIGRVQALLLDSIAADLETWQSYLDLDLENTDSGQVTVTSSSQGLRYLSGEYSRLHPKRKHNFSG
jgi:hypothetical protein